MVQDANQDAHSAILRILSRRSPPCAKMIKTFLRSFFSSPPACDPGSDVGTGSAESSISAYCKCERGGAREGTYVHVKVTTEHAPEHPLKRRHAGAIDRSSDEPGRVSAARAARYVLEIKAAKGVVGWAALLDVAQERRVGLVKALADLGAASGGVLEEDVRLTEHLTGLLELERALLEGVVTRVHRSDAGLRLGETGIELLERLGEGAAGMRAGGVVERTDRDALGPDLGGEEAEATLGLVTLAHLRHVRALERVHVRVELGQVSPTSSALRSYVFELDALKRSEVLDRAVRDVDGDVELRESARPPGGSDVPARGSSARSLHGQRGGRGGHVRSSEG